MNIYQSNGYLNIRPIAADPSWLKVIIGARQVGKTYNTLLYYLEERAPFILLRRTTEELDMIQSAELNPFKAFEPAGYNVGIYKRGKLLTINDYNSEEPEKPQDPRGLVLSLPQIAHIRGFSGSGYNAMVFDEFIPEKGVRVLKSEGAALLNAYVTINGNRELENRPPLTLWLLANSNDLNSPILEALNLTDDIITMRVKGLEVLQKPGVIIVQPFSKGVIDRRKDTALMKQISKESEFYGMAINNEFSYNRSPLVKNQSIKGYKPLFSYDNKIYAWEGPNQIYICKAPHKVSKYGNSEFDRASLATDFFWIRRAYDCGLVNFSDHRMLILFQWLFDIDY